MFFMTLSGRSLRQAQPPPLPSVYAYAEVGDFHDDKRKHRYQLMQGGSRVEGADAAVTGEYCRSKTIDCGNYRS